MAVLGDADFDRSLSPFPRRRARRRVCVPSLVAWLAAVAGRAQTASEPTAPSQVGADTWQ